MDWTKGFSARYYITVVDKDTWRDTEKVQITGGTIKRSVSDLQQSADINVVNYNKEGEPLIRVWLDAKQGNDSSHTPLFTGLATTPGRNINGRPVDINAIDQVKRLLRVTKAPVEISGDTSKCGLKNAVIAEQNETNLSMAYVLLNAFKWRIVIDGYGKIWLKPNATEPSLTLDTRTMDIVEPNISDDYDWFDCPNVFRAVAGETYAEFRDEDPNSPLSIVRRGREVWAEETSCDLAENETLAGYARRRLKELQKVGRTVSYDRRYLPDINVSDVVRLNYPAQGIMGNFAITNQNVELGFGAKTSEEVMQV